MRIRALVIAACVVALPALAQMAWAGGAKSVQVPLPAVQAGSVGAITVVVKGSGGIRVRTANDSALGNLGLVYAVGKPARAGATSKWTVAVFIKRFTAARRLAGAGGTVDVVIDRVGETTVVNVGAYVPANCQAIEAFDKGFEGGASVNLNGATFSLQNGRTPSEQPSPPEEVMDNIIASSKHCPGFTPEGDDPGNT